MGSSDYIANMKSGVGHIRVYDSPVVVPQKDKSISAKGLSAEEKQQIKKKKEAMMH